MRENYLSPTFLLCVFLGFRFANPGRCITSGQFAGQGVPHSREITISCWNSSLALKKLKITRMFKLWGKK